MEATMLYRLPHSVHRYDSLYPSVIQSQSSYVRSTLSASRSAPQSFPPAHYLPYASSLPAGSPSSSSGSANDRSHPASPPQYGAEADAYDSAPSGGAQIYPGGYSDAHPNPWSVSDKHIHHLADMYASGSFDLTSAVGLDSGDNALTAQYVKPEDSAVPPNNYAPLEPYYGLSGPEPLLADYANISGPPPSMSYGFGQHVQPNAQSEADSSYMLISEELQYPMSPDHVPRFVHPAQVSPNISPASAFAQLQGSGSPPQSLDPRFTVSPQMTKAAVSPFHGSGSGNSDHSPPHAETLSQRRARSEARKRLRQDSFSSRSSGEYRVDSGESERQDDDGDEDYEGDEDADDDDGEFVLGTSPSARTRRRRAVSSASDAPSTASYGQSSARRLAAPVPIPHLTKKSRGRRVPTAPVIISKDGVQKNMRTYTCDVPGCGKCFARGEHLKRHVRSIHTNEKPHKCPYPSCGKEFSRHDNLGQHMRVHKNYSAPKSSRL